MVIRTHRPSVTDTSEDNAVSGKRPTLADVATRAGTSTAVVSYVLNNGPRPVSESLRARVVNALDELNYRPDTRARALRRPRRWQQIGLLVPDLTLPLFGEFVGRIEIEARARDHLTMIGNTGYDPERELEFATAFTEVGVDGLVVIGAANARETAKLCSQERVPVVWMHNVRGEVDAEIVGVDHELAGAIVTGHLVDVHHCSDIAFIGGITEDDAAHGDLETVKQRFAGVRGRAGADVTVVPTNLTADGAYAAVSQFLSGVAHPPQALVVGTFGQASATIRAVTDAGLAVGTEIRVVGFDGHPHDYGQFDVTAAQQPVETITARAVARLLDEPTSDDPIAVSLHIGVTCGCTPQA
ncbi:LacI family transcriptional regulator [Mycolicibacterium murale]|uniref:LacI family transcriptional regulator n=1 Tax=Mycolicibacterium murale TaxID=182220 RepID=A0A7I9WQF5_9MYCO|nr:LacI family transcriptional regulator [Mycolicibacterium murale]